MSLVRIAASAAIFTLLSAVGATAKPVVTTGETNLRKGPGTDTEALTLIPKGTTVEVGTCTNGWCEITLDGKTGFAFAPNLGLAPRRPPPPRGPVVADGGVVTGPPGPPVYGPRPYMVGPPMPPPPPPYYGYYRPWPYGPYGYGPYYGYGWGYRGWGWRW